MTCLDGRWNMKPRRRLIIRYIPAARTAASEAIHMLNMPALGFPPTTERECRSSTTSALAR